MDVKMAALRKTGYDIRLNKSRKQECMQNEAKYIGKRLKENIKVLVLE